jgi:DNA repair protein RadC
MAQSKAKDTRATYDLATDEADILARAEDILRRRLERMATIGSPRDTMAFLRMRLGGLLAERFDIVLLDNRHRVIAVEELFQGTIDGASVWPREIVRCVLKHNAAAIICTHNHPSGVAEPSAADRAITAEIKRALECISVRVLDHIVVSAGDCVSMAERGLM